MAPYRTSRLLPLVILLSVFAIGLGGVLVWQLESGGASGDSPASSTDEVRIAARKVSNDRTEVALQTRDGAEWSELVTPDSRFLPADAEMDQWRFSSPIALDSERSDGAPLKIALLQTIHGSPVERRNAFRLAIADINNAGGVFGRPVLGVIADFNLDEEFIVASAKRLVEEDGINAFVGPTFSSSSVIIARQVSSPLQIPTVSPSASSPLVTTADPDDFFFRTTPSDGAGQGDVLATLASEQGHERIGVLYRDDAYGSGLAAEVAAAFDGQLVSRALDHTQPETYLSELEAVATGDATLLMVLGCWQEAATVIMESLEHGLFDQFLLGDCAQSGNLFSVLGPEIAVGLTGTSPTFGEENNSTRLFNLRFTEMFGQPPPPNVTFVPSVYDATIAVALAAQAAGSIEGVAIRDQLRGISDGEGAAFTSDRLAEALAALKQGEDIDYTGAVSSMDWDANGDITRFTIGVWRFAEDGQIEVIRRIPVDLNE